MKFNSVADFNEAILHEEGNKFGFEVEQVKYCEFYVIKSDYVNFTIHTDYSKTDWSSRVARRSLKMTASISTMGGQPTVEELMKASEDIRNAAEFMKKFNEMDIEIIERY